MASVNSLIIEGTFRDGKLVTNRKYRDGDGNVQTEECFFPVHFLNKKMEELCVDGKKVRFVARLSQVDNQVVIVPEHIEVK